MLTRPTRNRRKSFNGYVKRYNKNVQLIYTDDADFIPHKTYFGGNRKQLFPKSRAAGQRRVLRYGQIRGGGGGRNRKKSRPAIVWSEPLVRINLCVYIMHSLPAIIITAYTAVHVRICTRSATINDPPLKPSFRRFHNADGLFFVVRRCYRLVSITRNRPNPGGPVSSNNMPVHV